MQPTNDSLTIATTTSYQDATELRAVLARRFVKEAVEKGHRVVIVDASPDKKVREGLRALGALVEKQDALGMGHSRRTALHAAFTLESENAAAEEPVVAWVEPEKYPLVPHLGRLAHAVKCGVDIVIPRRRTLRSYPKYQEACELRGNWEAGNITGRPDLDLWSGPRVMNARGLAYFLGYSGTYGDKWESIFIPVAQAIADGLRIRSVVIDYEHPPEQRDAEEGDPAMDRKRDEQMENILTSLNTECGRLGLPR